MNRNLLVFNCVTDLQTESLAKNRQKAGFLFAIVFQCFQLATSGNLSVRQFARLPRLWS